jgi:hypothetical protein
MPVCGCRKNGTLITTNPSLVTCPDCRAGKKPGRSTKSAGGKPKKSWFSLW